MEYLIRVLLYPGPEVSALPGISKQIAETLFAVQYHQSVAYIEDLTHQKVSAHLGTLVYYM